MLFIQTDYSMAIVARPDKNPPKSLLILGDSLTEGYGVSKDSAYPALLEKKINSQASGPSEKWRVISSGISGSTTASAVPRLKWLFKNKYDLVLIVLGANDGLRGIKVSESKKNLSLAIELALRNKNSVAVSRVLIPPNYGKEYEGEFKKMFTDLSKKYPITLIPFILDKVAGDPKLNLADGIHPNEKGHIIVAENVYNALKQTFFKHK